MDDTGLTYKVYNNIQAQSLAAKAVFVYIADGPINWKQADADWLAEFKKEASKSVKTGTVYYVCGARKGNRFFIKPYRGNGW